MYLDILLGDNRMLVPERQADLATPLAVLADRMKCYPAPDLMHSRQHIYLSVYLSLSLPPSLSLALSALLLCRSLSLSFSLSLSASLSLYLSPSLLRPRHL